MNIAFPMSIPDMKLEKVSGTSMRSQFRARHTSHILFTSLQLKVPNICVYINVDIINFNLVFKMIETHTLIMANGLILYTGEPAPALQINVCVQCGKLFKRRGSLRDHLASKHNVGGIRCNQCDR